MVVGCGLEVIFFDATGTLFDVRDSVGTIYSEIAARHNVPTDAAELDISFRTAFDTKTREAFPPGGLLGPGAEKAWWKDVVAHVLSGAIPTSTFERYFDDVFDVFRSKQAWIVYEDTRASLEKLRAAGYGLAIISNFDTRLLDVLAALEIDGLFDKVVLSWRVGAAKPDIRLFLRALEEMKVTSGRALHVGDSPEEDAEGALSAGIQPVLLDRDGRFQNWSRGLRVESLTELCSIILKP
jgi:putative hydrolase of the HAD superfamily